MKELQCKFCGKICKKEGTLVLHEKSCSKNPDSRNFQNKNKTTKVQESWKQENGLYKCPHCGKEFNKHGISNHIWSKHTDFGIKKRKEICSFKEFTNSKYGDIKEHKKICQNCGKEFIFVGRKNSRAYQYAKFCCKSCAHDRSSWWKDHYKSYRTLGIKYWGKQCEICGFDKIVEVHHFDKNHFNNDVNNLIVLCPNHHRMIHTKKYEKEVTQQLLEIRSKKLENI